MSSPVQITDVTLRDGLQMVPQVISLPQKLKLAKQLLECGFNRIELTSFVNPKWVPQFSDSEAFCEAFFSEIKKETALEWMAFVPNPKGLERLLKFPIQWAGAFIATSNSFNQKNVNCSIEESLNGLREIIDKAHSEERKVRVYVSTVFGCPYEGKMPVEAVLQVLSKVAQLNPDEIALSDTIGVATPSQIKEILQGFSSSFGLQKTALHLHNTYGLALASAQTAYDLGLRKFDASTGGIGGCPYAMGASGNVSAEELMYLFSRQGMALGFKRNEMMKAVRLLKEEMGLKTTSHLAEIVDKGGKIYEGE